MADNVNVDSGSGIVVSTDELGDGSHAQNMKLLASPSGSSAGLGHLEDAAHADGDAGIMALAVRKDTAAALAGTDGDYAPLEVDAAGKLHVNVGESALPSGASTAAKQDTGNTALAAIQAAIEGTVAVDGSGVTQPVSASALPLPTGAATAARQDTANTALAAIQAAAETLDNAISGSEMQVDVVAPLPAGTNAIGKLAANDGVDIGDVDVASVVPGTGATNLGKAEDAAHSTGDVGVMALGVRKAADGPHSGADGDYEPLQTDENGYLKVNIKAGAGSGGTASTDDAAFTPGSGSGTPMMGLVTADAVDSGDVGVVGMDANRNLKVSIEADNAGIGGGTQYTEDDAAPTNPVGTAMMMERDDALGGLTPAEGDWTHPFCNANGAQWVKHDGDMPISDGGNVISVDDGGATLSVDDGGGALTVDNGGTFAVQAESSGDVAHDAADSGNPVKIGAQARTTLPSAVADADRVNLIADDVGRLITRSQAPRDLVTHNTITLSNTTETTLLSAGGAGVFLDIVSLVITNTSSTAVRVDIRDSTSGTVRWSIMLAADGGGVVFNPPLPLTQGTANNNWTAQLSGAVTDVRVFALAVQEV